MNKNITEEELLLRKRARRRLVGAVVLTIVAIIVLPLIFDEPKPDDTDTHEIDIHLFPEDDTSSISPMLSSKIRPADVPEQVSGQSNLEPETSPDLPLSLQQPSQLEDIDQDEDADQHVEVLDNHIPIPGIKPRLAVVQTDTPKPIHTASEYVIQLGAFSDQLKAQQQLDILRSNGLNAYMESHKVNNNVVTRVRFGTFLDRETAENELDKLRKLGLNGVVTSK